MKLAIVRNPRSTGGSNQRLETWRRLADQLDIEVVELPLEPEWSAAVRAPGTLRAIAAGRAVPEALIWNERSLRRRLEEIEPDAVLLQTMRAYSDALTDGPWVTVLDFVDRLSVSYRQRAGVSGRATAKLLRTLARFHERAEKNSPALPVRRVTAGRSGAGSLGIPWIPILGPQGVVATEPPKDPEFDAVFFGSLNYPPNYEALHWLSGADGIDEVNLLVTGSRAHPSVEPLCDLMGWTFEADYPDVGSLAERAAVAVVPLVSAAGIQIKVLEAAAHGIPQVATAMAMQGFDQAFPVQAASGLGDIAGLVASLSKDIHQRELLALRAKRHVDDNYQAESWVRDFEGLISRT